MISIAKPLIGEEEIKAVTEVLKSGMLAQGKVVKEFENVFSEYIDVREAIAVSNGTAALDIVLKALGVTQGDEIITTPFTFIATANSILFQGAKPVFADIDEQTFTLDPDDVLEKITNKTRGIVGVHLFGHPFDLKPLQEICEDYDLFLVEDCAQAHGAEYEGKKVGSFRIGCFSFYPTKNMTTGEGGMITTNSKKLAELCRLLRNHGESTKYLHTILGHNYRMTNIEAAIGIAQLKKLDKFNEARINNAEYLNTHLRAKGLTTPYKRRYAKHVYHQYVLKIENDFLLSREEFIKYLHDKDIECAVHYPLPIYKQPLYRELGYGEKNVDCPFSSEISKKVVSLPVHPALTRDNLKYIVNVINNIEV